MTEGATRSWRSLWVETSQALDGDAAEARWLCQEASGLEGLAWLNGLDRPAGTRAVAHLDRMVARRRAGEPIQYVLGHWSFRRLDLMVDRRVLIPRPETEQVVEVALAILREVGRPLVAVDLGTGSGAIALSLAAELPMTGVTIWATDRSADALHVATANLAAIGRCAANVRIAEGDWFAALPEELRGRLALVVSNPPYVAHAEELPEYVEAWEPIGALRSGPAGLGDLERLIAEAPAWLAPGGALVLEIGATQGDAAAARALEAGFDGVDVRQDLAERDRILVATKRG